MSIARARNKLALGGSLAEAADLAWMEPGELDLASWRRLCRHGRPLGGRDAAAANNRPAGRR